MVRGILLVGIPSTGPIGIKMTCEVDQLIQSTLAGNGPQKIPAQYTIQGKRNHLDQLEIRLHPNGLELWACFKEIPNMVQMLSPGEWISIGLLRNPAQLFQIDGILQTKTFREIVERAQTVLSHNEWNTPTQELEFVDFLQATGEGFVPGAC